MWWMWPHLRRVWAGAGAILAGLTVTYLYSLLSEQALPHLRVASKLSHDYWPWLVTVTLMLAGISVFAERAHRQREARAPRPLRIARPTWRERFRGKEQSSLAGAISTSTMVGRDGELARLTAWFAEAGAGARRVIFVSGEPGIGKSTLTRAFLDAIANQRAVRVGRGQCVEQYGAGEPYMPILEALTRMCREPGGEMLVAILHRMAPAWLAQMPSLIGAEDRARLHGQSQGITQQRMLREMAEALEVLAAETPLVLFLEDLHWSDHSTLDLITVIAQRTEPARLMILGTYRPVEMLAGKHPLRALTAERQVHNQCEELRLSLLSKEEVRNYLSVRLAGKTAEQIDHLASAVYQRSEGNPLFMVNVVDDVVAQGLSFDKSRIEAPRNIVQMIERNLERLQPDEQAILEGASVAGAEFATAAVAAALQRPVIEVEAYCNRMARREQFVSLAGEARWPDGTVSANVRFLHALYREALYERVPPVHRVELHRRVAELYETAFGNRTREIAAALASHYARANDNEKAIIYLTITAQQALQRSAHADAAASASQGLKLLAMLPVSAPRATQELALQTILGISLMPIKGWSVPEVEQAFARAEELCRGLDETPELNRVLYGIWGFFLARGELRRATEPALRLLEIARKTADSASFMAAHCSLGITYFWTGDLLKSSQHFEDLNRHYEKHLHASLTSQFGVDVGIFGMRYSSFTLWLRGFPDQAVKAVERSIEMARETGHGETLAWARQVDSHLHMFRRENVQARVAAEEVFSLCDSHGLVIQSALVKMSHGWAVAVAGDHATGCAEIREAFHAFAAAGLILGESTHRMFLAQALLLAGHI